MLAPETHSVGPMQAPPHDRSGVDAGPGPQGSDLIGEGAFEEGTVGYHRSSIDVLQAAVRAAIAVVLLAVTLIAEDAMLGFERDLILLFDFLSPSIERFLQGSLELASALVSVGVFTATSQARVASTASRRL